MTSSFSTAEHMHPRLLAWPPLSQLGPIADYCRCSHFRVTGNLKADVLAFRQLAS